MQAGTSTVEGNSPRRGTLGVLSLQFLGYQGVQYAICVIILCDLH